jgi:hypothetical protein
VQLCACFYLIYISKAFFRNEFPPTHVSRRLLAAKSLESQKFREWTRTKGLRESIGPKLGHHHPRHYTKMTRQIWKWYGVEQMKDCDSRSSHSFLLLLQFNNPGFDTIFND